MQRFENKLCKLQFLGIFVCMFSLMSTNFAYAEIPDCTIGDLTQGEWVELDRPDECPFKGQLSMEDSVLPTADRNTFLGVAYNGKYKMVEGPRVIGWWGKIPECTDLIPYGWNTPPFNCIEGLSQMSAQYFDSYEPILDCSATGGVAKCVDNNPDDGKTPTHYLRVCSRLENYYEWQCNNSTPTKKPLNQGPQQCPI